MWIPLTTAQAPPRLLLTAGSVDRRVLELVNLKSQSVWIPIVSIFSDTTSVLAYGLPLAVAAAGLLRRRPAILEKGLWCLCIVFAADYLALLVKNLVDRPRPYEVYRWVVLSTDGGNSSFPSGHTIQACSMAIGMAMLFPGRRLRAVLLSWAGAVGLSRICLGAHYPSDVAGAVLIALIVAVLVLGLRNAVARSR